MKSNQLPSLKPVFPLLLGSHPEDRHDTPAGLWRPSPSVLLDRDTELVETLTGLGLQHQPGLWLPAHGLAHIWPERHGELSNGKQRCWQPEPRLC